MNNKILAATFISLAAILWGFDGVVLTPRLFNLDVGFVVFMIHTIPFILMNFFLFKQYKELKKFSNSDFLYMFLIALFGGALGTIAIVKALFLVNFHHLSVVVLLQKLQPIFAIILAYVLLKEKLKERFIEWALVAVIASYFLTFGFSLPNLNTGGNDIYAAIWAIIAAFSFGSATVFGKKIVTKYSFTTTTFFRFGFTSVIMAVYVALTGAYAFGAITSINWLIFIIIALTTGSGAIFLYYYGLTKVKAMVSTICELFFPISAIIFDYFINGTVLSTVQWVSAIIMVVAIINITKT